ncbi:MAG: prenylated flavin chaperone LpdD [Eubacteriales bacterium]
MLKQMSFEAGEGKFKINLIATVTDDGFVVQLLGGDRPHVGAVALSVPRPSLSDPARTSCNTSVLPLTGHKDDEVAKPVAEEITKACGRPVVVIAGIHIDRAGAADIKQLVDNCFDMARQLIREMVSQGRF